MPGAPQQRYTTGEPGRVQGRDRVGIVECSLAYRARGVSIRGKFVLSRNPGYKTRVSAMWLNVFLTPGWLSPKSKFRYGCELQVLLPPLPRRASVFGEKSFYRAPGCKWAQKTCAGCLSSGTPREIQAKLRGRTVWVL